MDEKQVITSGTLSPLDGSAVPDALVLWNEAAARCEIPHKPMDPDRFTSLFLPGVPEQGKVCIGFTLDGRLLGFAAGNVKPGSAIGYLTFVLVAPDARRAGIGTVLAHAVEEALAETASTSGTPLESMDARFLNPSALEWIVPGTDGHDHPNAPGVDASAPAYLFMKNVGYRDLEMVNSFHRSLDTFAYSPAIAASLARLEDEGLRITRYDASRHTGLEGLVEDLGSPVWRETLLTNAAKPGGGLPVLIVEDGDRVCGFAGPMDVQPSGRGYFNGIGMHSAYRKRGAGKALFSALCMNLKEMGATFMTLFTGETNPARNIYESAGFKIVKVWACMRKNIQQDDLAGGLSRRLQ